MGGKVVNFGNGFSLPKSIDGKTYIFRRNEKVPNGIELYCQDSNTGVCFVGNKIYTDLYGGLWTVPCNYKWYNDITKIYSTSIMNFGIKDFEILSLTSTVDSGDETFALDINPKFLLLQEINTDTKLKISVIDYDNKTFTISRSDESGEEITFHAFVIN